jgi:hypothetical protein
MEKVKKVYKHENKIYKSNPPEKIYSEKKVYKIYKRQGKNNRNNLKS